MITVENNETNVFVVIIYQPALVVCEVCVCRSLHVRVHVVVIVIL